MAGLPETPGPPSSGSLEPQAATVSARLSPAPLVGSVSWDWVLLATTSSRRIRARGHQPSPATASMARGPGALGLQRRCIRIALCIDPEARDPAGRLLDGDVTRTSCGSTPLAASDPWPSTTTSRSSRYSPGRAGATSRRLVVTHAPGSRSRMSARTEPVASRRRGRGQASGRRSPRRVGRSRAGGSSRRWSAGPTARRRRSR